MRRCLHWLSLAAACAPTPPAASLLRPPAACAHAACRLLLRPQHSLEVVCLLLALKLTFPNRVFLVRGNHECRSVSGHFGFKEECVRKYGLPVYYRFLLCFQTMPIGALVHTDYGTMLALHGGLSPKIARLEQLEELDRFVEPEEEQSLLEVLWSDPIQIREKRGGEAEHARGDDREHFLHARRGEHSKIALQRKPTNPTNTQPRTATATRRTLTFRRRSAAPL